MPSKASHVALVTKDKENETFQILYWSIVKFRLCLRMYKGCQDMAYGCKRFTQQNCNIVNQLMSVLRRMSYKRDCFDFTTSYNEECVTCVL